MRYADQFHEPNQTHPYRGRNRVNPLANRSGLLLWAILLSLTVALSGCFLASNREINLLVIRTESGGSEVTVTYRMPPPREGNVYVLWVLNADLGNSVRVGTVAPSSQLRAIRTKVDFWATAAVISIESSANVSQMSDTWVLVSGQMQPSKNTTGAGTPTK